MFKIAIITLAVSFLSIFGVMTAETTETSATASDSNRVEKLAPKLKANFIAYDRVGRQPLKMLFRDSSVSPNKNIVSRIWDFGDSLASAEEKQDSRQRIAHTYKSAGTYCVRLTVKEASGSTAEVIKNDYIRVLPAKSYNKVALSVFPTMGVRLGSQVTNGETFMSFINLDFMTFIGFVNSVGVNFEVGRHKSSGLYAVFSGGGEVLWVRDPDWNISKGDNIYMHMIPHLTAGLGWQFVLYDGNIFYIECDVGAKNFLSGFYLGMLF